MWPYFHAECLSPVQVGRREREGTGVCFCCEQDSVLSGLEYPPPSWGRILCEGAVVWKGELELKSLPLLAPTSTCRLSSPAWRPWWSITLGRSAASSAPSTWAA